jgi:hypothetical protein
MLPVLSATRLLIPHGGDFCMFSADTSLSLPFRLLLAALMMVLLISSGYAGPPI